ncbi:MAG: hypothetical protein IKQ94_00005, partial [Bacteroidales bacterium]|nr:hypothetical protein [Bacteroidales bacterium]
MKKAIFLLLSLVVVTNLVLAQSFLQNARIPTTKEIMSNGIQSLNFENLNRKMTETPPLYIGGLFDSITDIKIINTDKLKSKYSELSSARKKNCDCNNAFAIKVMEQRIRLLIKINQLFRDRYTHSRDVDCIFLNFNLLTGVKHEYDGDGDFIGPLPFSMGEISQFEEWLSQNKQYLCIDMESRIL